MLSDVHEFINSRMATIGKYCDVPVYSGKMSWHSVLFRHIPWYSAIFRDIPPYSVIFRHSGFSQRPRGKYCLIFQAVGQLTVVLYSVPWLIFCSIIGMGGGGVILNIYVQQVCLPNQNVHIQGYCWTIFYSNTTEIWYNSWF
jgi:hypothetical protein